MLKIMTPPIKETGGPGIFMHRLLSFMQEREMITVVRKKPNIYFSSVWLGEPPRKTTTVYRAASAYYNTMEVKRKGMNRKLAVAIQRATYVIYQSAFARKLTKKILYTKARRYSIIYNGFDISPYSNTEEYKTDKKHVFIAVADWTSPIKRLSATIKSFLMAEIPNSELIVVGQLPRVKIGKYRNVRFTGRLPMKEIAFFLKSKPIFLSLSYAETCSNAVVEALNFGCPIICGHNGGTPEIINDSGFVIKYERSFQFERHKPNLEAVNYKLIIDAMRQATEKKWEINRPDLSMEYCAKKYLEVFESLKRST